MKKILVLYQDFNDWFLNDYDKFEHWFKEKDGAYDKDNEYYILSLGNHNEIIHPEDNIAVELFKSSTIRQIFDLVKFRRRLKEIISEFEPDYIYSPFIYLLSTVPKGDYKVVGFLRDITSEMVKAKGGIRKVAGNIFYILDYLAFKKIDILLYNSPYLKNYALKLGFKGELVFSPRDVVDKEFFDDADPQEILEKYRLANKKVILTVARLTKEKNIEMGIKAMRYLPNDYVYLIVGEGPEKKDLEILAEEFRVDDRVIFVGFVKHKELWKFYKVADVLWLLSKSNFEGIPNVIMEAWYAKLPIIVSKIGALSSIVKDGKTGIVLKSWSEKELAKKTLELINNKNLYNILQTEGYNTVNKLIKKHIPVKNIFV
ncbi:Glycosyl transferase group 1 [Methanocaldococcus lauensis]|nr:Glycosyl transferase group 1 [Methanocaldococcus lauensis]